MPGYRKIVVGADGSEISDIAVAKAATLAMAADAELIIAAAAVPKSQSSAAAADQLGSDGFLALGRTTIEDVLREAAKTAAAAGMRNSVQRSLAGQPLKALLAFADQAGADLLVIPNHGVDTRAGQWLGSMGTEAVRKSHVDVLAVRLPTAPKAEHRCWFSGARVAAPPVPSSERT